MHRIAAPISVFFCTGSFNFLTRMKELAPEPMNSKAGNIVLIELATSVGVTELFCGFGRLGASAESVAAEAVKEARAYLVSEAAVGEHLADQLLLPFALAGGGVFTAEKLNRHARTNMDVISNFLAVSFAACQEVGHTRIEVTSNT